MCGSKDNGEASLEVSHGSETSEEIDDEGNEVCVPRINFGRISSLNVQGKGISPISNESSQWVNRHPPTVAASLGS